jgi:hypothetical protein
MARSYTRVESRFRQAADFAQDKLEDAIKKGIAAGEERAKARLKPGRGVDTGAYEAGIHTEVQGLTGMIVFPGTSESVENPAHLEFGTVNAKAVPHMRPAATAARKTFLNELGGDIMRGFKTVRGGGQTSRLSTFNRRTR